MGVLVGFLAVVFLVLAGVAGPFAETALAGDATAAPPLPGVGEVARIARADGTPLGTVGVTALEDPFLGEILYEEPQPGFRLLRVDVTVQNTSDRPLDFFAWGFGVVGDDGVVYAQSVAPTGGDLVRFDAGGYVPVASAAAASGAVLFQLPDGVALAQVLYQPFNVLDAADELFAEEIHVVVLDQRQTRPAFGDAVELAGDGEDLVVARAFDLTAPYSGADPSMLPAGYRVVGVTISLERTSGGPGYVDPSMICLVDADGSVRAPLPYGPVVVYRTDEAIAAAPDLPALATQNSGETATGFVGFVLPDGVEPAAIVFSGQVSSASLDARFVYLAEVGVGEDGWALPAVAIARDPATSGSSPLRT
jgi:hypothetical protein